MAKKRLMCNAGVIDAGYLGEVIVLMENLGNEPYSIRKGDKVALLLEHPLLASEVVEDERTEAARGVIGANARWLRLQKKLEIGIHYLGGNGVGRYGTSGLPDATIHANSNVVFNSQACRCQPGYASPLFNNTGCGKQPLPTLGIRTRRIRKLHRRHSAYGRGNRRLPVQALQRAKGPSADGQHSYLSRSAWSVIGGTPKPPRTCGSRRSGITCRTRQG